MIIHPERVALPLSLCFAGLCVGLVSGCSQAVHIETLVVAAPADAASAGDAVAQERSFNARTARRRTIAVMPFRVEVADSTYAPLGFGFAELLLSDLAVSHQLDVLERTHLEDMTAEIARSTAGETDARTAVHAGRRLAAQQLVVGSLVVPRDDAMSFSSVVAEVSSGALLVPLRGGGSMDQLFAAERRLALRLFTELGVRLTKKELAELDAKRAPNMKAFLSFSRGVEAEARGRFDDAAAHFEAAASLDPSFSLAREHRQHLLEHTPGAGGNRAAASGAAAKGQASAPAKAPAPAGKAAPKVKPDRA